MSLAPAPGMGATEIFHSDRHACTVVAVAANGRSLTVQSDTAIRLDKNGMSDQQEYRFERNVEGSSSVYTLRRNGHWVLKGESMHNGRSLWLGQRDEYYNFSF